MKFKMYYQGGVYELDKEKGKGKIYKIINESTPKHVDKLFSEKSSVDTTLIQLLLLVEYVKIILLL